MKRLLRILCSAIVTFLTFACSDSPSMPTYDPDNGDFEGIQRIIILGDEANALMASEITISFLSESGVRFTRKAIHSRSGGCSTFSLDRGLAEGTYRLLSAEYIDEQAKPGENDKTSLGEFGFGSRISVTSHGISVIDNFDPVLGYAGLGSKENPYIISSASHLFNLMMIVNDYDSNRMISTGTYFRQVCDIDMKQASLSCDMGYGWLPIGADPNTPFRGIYLGDGHKITKLFIDRPHSVGIGLFGFLCEASVDGVNMNSCTISGQFAVGSVAGAVISSGGNLRNYGTFTNCTATDCKISGPSTSVSLGGILGAADMHAKVLLAECKTQGGSISGGMNVGGIAGGCGMYSSVMISGCDNNMPVTSLGSGAGGMIGTADTLQVVSCRNMAEIKGSTDAKSGLPVIGAGGIAGGSGTSWITGSQNAGRVSGIEGVGGIIGSTRVCGSDSEGFIYNQSVLRHCSNSGAVSGTRFVGGTIGEAQAGTYNVCNSGAVSGTDYVGGICGTSSVAVIHNSLNSGNIDGSRYVSGIIGKCTWGSLAIDQNMGSVTGKSGHTAGVVALAGNNTVVHYCANFGTVSGPSSHPVGGLIGEIGDPREWTAENIAECVIGSLECVMAIAGPVLAVVEGVVGMAKSVEFVLKIVETGADIALQISDYTLIGFSIAELVSHEVEEELSASMHSKTKETSAEITEHIKTLRNSCTGSISNFDNTTLSPYINNIANVVSYYDVEGNDEKYNDAINETRAERAEAVEKYAHAKEIFHTVIAGVAVVTSTATLIAGSIASGGTATAILLVGSAASLVGGVNAIVKSCTDFEENAVVISQCVNAGTVKSQGNNKASSIVGKMSDYSVVYDCLNTAKVESGKKGLFAGDVGNRCEILRCVSLAQAFDPYNLNSACSVICDPTLSGDDTFVAYNNLVASCEAMSKISTYSGYYFNIGENSLWNIPSGYPFPIPNVSQMQK